MQSIQLKIQKAVILGALLLSSILIVYALGFSTHLYALSYHADPSSSLFYVEGAELYRNAQPFNRLFFSQSILCFLVCLTMLLTLTHRRRLYYVSNYITSAASAGLLLYMGINLWSYASLIKSLYRQIDFEKLREVTEMMRMRYVESTLMFDLGLALGALLFIAAASLCANLVMKTLWMRHEKWADEGEVAL